MARRTAEDTRELLLDIGLELLAERGVTSPVSHIRLQDVLKRAGLTTGAAYRLWDYQEDFHVDLAATALRHRDEHPTEFIGRSMADLVAHDAPLEQLIRVGADAHIKSFGTEGDPLATTSFLVMLALRAAAQSHDELRAASRDRNAASVDAFVALYTALMERYGLRMREPFEVRDLALSIGALGEGFAIQAIEGEEHPRVIRPDATGTDQDWSVLGVAILGCVHAFTEPIDPDDRDGCDGR